MHDHTYYSQLSTADLLDRAFRGAWSGPELHMIRALAERLDDVNEMVDYLESASRRSCACRRRADSWRDEAQAVQRQLDMVRG